MLDQRALGFRVSGLGFRVYDRLQAQSGEGRFAT